jgi:hypothetical protein
LSDEPHLRHIVGDSRSGQEATHKSEEWSLPTACRERFAVSDADLAGTAA